MSGHDFGANQVVVYRGTTAPWWHVYCPCCDQGLGRTYRHSNAITAAFVHARRVHG